MTTRQALGFSKFKKTVPKPVGSASEDLVKTGFLEGGGRMPLVVRPTIEDADLAAWGAGARDFVDDKVSEHGAILFRGFQIPDVSEFERFAAAICGDLFGEYSDLPSEADGERVYKSTPYPKDKIILFHNESSHLQQWPRKQFFHCVRAAESRGETPITDCRVIYRELDPALRREFEERGLLYVRTFLESLDVSWRDFFRTDDREAVERYCRRSGTEYEWLDDGGLRTKQRCPAVITHPKTGEKVFFNQIQLHHIWFLEPEVRDSLASLFGADNMPRNVYFGDGEPIPDEAVEEIERLYWEHSTQFPWQEGDVLMVDNMLVAHARNPFEGERKIVVAMGEMVQRSQVA